MALIIIILVLDATFTPNLTFSGFLSPEISLGEKPITHSPTRSTEEYDSVIVTCSAHCCVEIL